jgi:L-2-hydroxycarboxylate dehydrogenase (NAD+)
MVIPYELLLQFTVSVFRQIGCPEKDAQTAAIALLSADLRGIDSHGVARLIGYVRLQEAGRANTKPNIRIIHETPSTAVVDGDGGLGLVVAPFAMQVAIEKAEKAGTGWVSVQNSNHFGIAGYHALQAVKKEMIGIAMTNASALVAPTFSIERLLGTNPICVAVPAGESEDAPLGWIQDKDGKTSTNPHELKTGGALLPLGGDRDHGSHKGYALGAVVDILSAVLSGANYGPWVPPFPAYVPMPTGMPGKGIGHFLGAMRIDAFRPAEDFKYHMDKWIRRFRSATPAPGHDKVLIPGDPEREMEAQRTISGIPLVPSVVEDLKALATKLNLEFPVQVE